MTRAQQAALLYGISAAGAAGVSYWLGRRGTDLAVDAVTYGAVAGTALNVVSWIASADDEREDLYAFASAALPNLGRAFFNGAGDGMGNMGKKAIELLSDLDTATLYADMRKNGVKVAPVPEDPNIVNQDHD